MGNTISLCTKRSDASFQEAEDEIEQLLKTFGVDANIRKFNKEDWDLDPTTNCDAAEELEEEIESLAYGVLGWKLQHLHFVYALALISSVTNHAVDFN